MSEVEIPEDVLERAAQAARLAYHSVPALSEGLLLPRWETVVKAVAWMLDDENTVVLAKCDERDALQARVEVLTAALTDALEGMEEMRPYVSDYFAEKWDHDSYITRARAALAAGETEETS